jgi:hypothetical protein
MQLNLMFVIFKRQVKFGFEAEMLKKKDLWFRNKLRSINELY